MPFCLYNKKNITRRLEDMNFIFSWQKQYFTRSLRSFVKYCLPLKNKIHTFAPPCNILYILLVFVIPIHWIAIYLVDCAIQLLINQSQMDKYLI